MWHRWSSKPMIQLATQKLMINNVRQSRQREKPWKRIKWTGIKCLELIVWRLRTSLHSKKDNQFRLIIQTWCLTKILWMCWGIRLINSWSNSIWPVVVLALTILGSSKLINRCRRGVMERYHQKGWFSTVVEHLSLTTSKSCKSTTRN